MPSQTTPIPKDAPPARASPRKLAGKPAATRLAGYLEQLERSHMSAVYDTFDDYCGHLIPEDDDLHDATPREIGMLMREIFTGYLNATLDEA